MKRYLKNQLQSITAAHMYVNNTKIKQALSTDIFQFLNSAYKWIGGFKSFTGEDDLVDSSYLWYITYEGKLPEREADIDIQKVYTVSVYKNKHGLKLVGIGNNRFETADESDRMTMKGRAKNAMYEHIKFCIDHGWAEVSGVMEDMFHTVIADKYLIDPEKLKLNLDDYSDIEILPDNIHYKRTLSSGIEVTKCAYGKIRY